MIERTVTISTDDHGEVTIPEPLWCVTDHSQPLIYRADISHIGATHRITVRTANRRSDLLSLSIEQFPFAESPEARHAHVSVAPSSERDATFSCTSDDLDRLTTDLLEAAGWVRRVGRRLTVESRFGGAW